MARLVEETIDVQAVARAVERPEAGAVLTFAGAVRNHARGRNVTGIEYHAYESMAVREMAKIEQGIRQRWPGTEVEIVHRVGMLEIGEVSVAIAVSTAHRGEAFAALRHAIDALKESAPVWKKELYTDGHAWIEGS